MERKKFLQIVSRGGGLAFLSPRLFAAGMSTDPPSLPGMVYQAVNGSPAENIAKVISLRGGIETLVGTDDIVIIKPNMQWWNQGAPNLSAMEALVGLIMSRPGFTGEVVIAENCHRGRDPAASDSSGWAHGFERNADIPGIATMNALASGLKTRYGDRYTTCHWIDSWVPGHTRVGDPNDGIGYVLCDGASGTDQISMGNDAGSGLYRETVMSYPIFITDRGTIVDYRYGEWKDGVYTGRPLRVINLAALNHHSSYCGYTAAVKNYLGVADLSGGAGDQGEGLLTGAYRNFHSFPFDGNSPGPVAGMLGAEIGVFLSTIRRADLHIVTAEWIGLQSRTEPPVVHTSSVLASTDPVALDAWAGRHLLYPHSGNEHHNPENPSSPPHQYLSSCAANGGGVFDLGRTQVETFDFDDSPAHAADDTPRMSGLGRNHPNPFNASTTIPFSLAESSPARVAVYTLQGQLAAVLVDRIFPAGRHAIVWDGTLHGGHMAASGVYVYQLTTPHGIFGNRMVLLR